MMNILLLSILFISPTFAIEELQPVFAADQSIITSLSMTHEAQQFRAIAKWKSIKAQLKSAEMQLEQKEKSFNRESELYNSGKSSESRLQSAEKDFLDSKDNVTQLKGAANLLKTSAELNQQLVLKEGNPVLDNRRVISQNMIDSLLTEEKNQKAALANAINSKSYYERRLSSYKTLFAQGMVSKSEIENKELELKMATDRIESLKAELEGISSSLSGLHKTQSRLGKSK